MPMLRSRCPQDNARASRHDPVSVAVPILDTGVLQEAHAQTFLSSPISAAVRWCRGAFTALQRPRRASLLYWYRWLKKRHLLCYAAVTFFFLLLITLLFISFAAIALTWDRPWTQILVQEYLSFQADSFHVRVPGAVQPREPARLWGLTVAPAQPLASPLPEHADRAAQEDYASRVKARLERQYGASLFLYTFVNGTEPNHVYRRLSLGYCGNHIQSVEMQLALNGAVLDGKGTAELCTTPMQRAKTNAEVLAMVDGRAMATTTGRDRETDELRHSIRSVEQHVPWHRGRVVIVSPGHHPTWVDGAKNFLAGACGDASVQALRTRGTHLRLTTVHQDALMPTHTRLTINTHSIEQQLWRVRNITRVHVYMNDDYFVNRDVAITDLFNEYGGTIVRVESTLITRAYTADTKMDSWAEGVIHTNHFTIRELDLMHEDEVSSSAVLLWKRQSDDVVQLNSKAIRRGSSPLPSFTGPSQRHAMWTMLELFDEDQSGNLTIPAAYTVEEVMAAYASKSFGVIRPHYYATHAPFVYCTNMLRFFATRYQREYAQSMFLHRSRGSTDLYVPFLYNAFVMARPWVASPRFPSYLLLQREMEREVDSRAVQLVDEAKRAGEAVDGNSRDALPQARRQAVEEMKKTLLLDPIQLDNCDGCAPATMLVGSSVNGCLFGRFTDNLGVNQLYMRQIAREKPLFFNVNSGWATPKAADQLRSFLQTKFPHSVFLEKTDAPPSDAEAAMTQMFKSLMELPVIGVVSYEEGVCPLVRSLSLAFAGHHRGRVHVVVQRPGGGDANETLREARTRLKHRVFSAAPVLRCAYGPQVTMGSTAHGDAIADVAAGVLPGGGGAGVALPSTCGGVGGGAAALRVRGFVIDARTPHAPVGSRAALPEALAVPGQTLALEDFRAVRVGPADGDVVLVLAREDAAAKAVHWVTGASENDLLLTFPLPVEAYEDLAAEVKWAQP